MAGTRRSVPARVRVLAVLGCGLAPACQQAPPAPAPDAGSWGDWAVGPVACKAFSTTSQVEESIIIPKCGRPGDPVCHSVGKYPPRLSAVGLIAPAVLEAKPTLHCLRDSFVDRDDPERSFFLAKIRPAGADKATCADGSDGGPKMPYADAPALTPQEGACLRWWVHEIAR